MVGQIEHLKTDPDGPSKNSDLLGDTEVEGEERWETPTSVPLTRHRVVFIEDCIGKSLPPFEAGNEGDPFRQL